MRIQTISKIALSLLGCLVALAAAELGLRLFASPWRAASAVSRVTDGRPYQVRQYYEGVATANFSGDGRRLTGNPPMAGAFKLLILGDSHVEAIQVSDTETMGSVLESRSRLSQHPLQVYQYGWNTGAPPYYALGAPALLKRWDPARVVVVLNGAADLQYQTLEGPVRAQMNHHGSVEVVDERVAPASPARWWYTLGVAVISRSTLAYHVYRAFRLAHLSALANVPGEGEPSLESSPSPQLEKAALVSIKALRAAYGSRLLIVYDPYLNGLHTSTADEGNVEKIVMSMCRQESVRCTSTRAALMQDRLTYGRLSRGFSNTLPGVGHWNRVGHQILAEVIWRALQDRWQEAR